MKQEPYCLNKADRATVLASMRECCTYRRWTLLAGHVRSTHVHVIVEANIPPEPIMGEFKRYTSRALNTVTAPRKHWSRHGSTRWLWSDKEVQQAMQYVIEEQGEPMAWFLAGRVS
jgi:REP element-mobilizing transposase RayT